MSTPKSWVLVTAVQTCLQSILTAGGYFTNAGINVTLEPAQVPDSASSVLCVFLDGTDRPQDPGIANAGRALSVMVVGKIPADLDGAQQAQHELLADIERAMTRSKENMALFAIGAQFPRFIESKFINRVEGLSWVGVAVRYQAHLTRIAPPTQ